MKTWLYLALAMLYVSPLLTSSGHAFAGNTTWEEQMEVARQYATTGRNYALIVSPLDAGEDAQGGVYVFYNNPEPFCYTYMIPGNWTGASEPNAYRSHDGKSFAGVLFGRSQDLATYEGGSLIERAHNLITMQYEAKLQLKLSGVKLEPFLNEHFKAGKWVADPLQDSSRFRFPAKVIVDLEPEAVAIITVIGTPDDDALARRIVNSLRTTTSSECYWPLLERMLKTVFSDDGNNED